MASISDSGDEGGRPASAPLTRWLVMAAIVVIVAVVLVVGREQLRLPSNITDDTVVARLGSVTTPYPPALRAAAIRARERPEDPTAAVAAARQYLDYGRSIGDARFAGAALGVLQPWIGKPDPEVLNLAADARQYGHDFAGAIALLDAALKVDPHNAQALLSRANIHIVQGRFRDADVDCLNLGRARRGDLAVLCDTTANALLAGGPDVYARLDRFVAAKAMDPALLGYGHSLLGEVARFLNMPDRAGPHFEAAHAASPADLRTLMVFADYLLAQGQPRHVLDLLAPAPPTDSIMVRQALAYKALGAGPELSKLNDALAQRFDEQARIGEAAHAREAARFYLYLAGQPDRALTAAIANWANQRELEDALLLIAAANAAGKPDAAKPVRDWAADEKVVAPMYVSAAAQGASKP